jgi:hypothetical protein
MLTVKEDGTFHDTDPLVQGLVDDGVATPVYRWNEVLEACSGAARAWQLNTGAEGEGYWFCLRGTELQAQTSGQLVNCSDEGWRWDQEGGAWDRLG